MDIIFLHDSIAAVCPIVGVAVGDPANKATWRIDFAPSATASQQTAAQNVVASFDPNALSPTAQIAALLTAGLQITSTSTPARSGTYAVDDSAKANIDGIYSGIKDGDGLPGGGTTFNYPDIGGVMRPFDAPSFSAFAKAVRDYLYSVSQGSPLQQPIPIP
jgi:hypothetical protein